MDTQRMDQRRWATRDATELIAQQLGAIDSWHRSHVAQQVSSVPRSREARMDASRRLEVLQRQHAAMVSRADFQLRTSGDVLYRRPVARAVVVHRQEWFLNKVTTGLRLAGIDVIAGLDNGADAVGAVIAEQPDLLLVEDHLPMQSGEEVIRLSRIYAPDTLVAAQVAYDDRIPVVLEAGAKTAFTRRVPPSDVVRDLELLLRG